MFKTIMLYQGLVSLTRQSDLRILQDSLFIFGLSTWLFEVLC